MADESHQVLIKSECAKSASANRPYFYVIGRHALPETEAFMRGMGYDVIINGGGSKTLNADVYAATLPPLLLVEGLLFVFERQRVHARRHRKARPAVAPLHAVKLRRAQRAAVRQSQKQILCTRCMRRHGRNGLYIAVRPAGSSG